MPGASFLDPRVLARIDNLELLARTVVDGFINGLHHAPYLGFSVDFAEHRAYMPGDDTRRVDWRVWARTDRFYVKEFEADTDANFSVLFDISRSMSYTSGGPSKLDYGRYLAACLSYLSRRQRDRVGMVTFDAGVVDYIPSSARHLEIILHTLDRLRPGGPGDLAGSLRKIAEIFRRRSIVLLLSDLYHDPAVIVDAVNLLRFRGNDVIVFHLLDPAELTFPFTDAASFEDLESGERMPIVPEQLREQYRAQIGAHTATLGRLLGDNRVDYWLCDTSQPLDHSLFAYLSTRQRLGRVR